MPAIFVLLVDGLRPSRPSTLLRAPSSPSRLSSHAGLSPRRFGLAQARSTRGAASKAGEGTTWLRPVPITIALHHQGGARSFGLADHVLRWPKTQAARRIQRSNAFANGTNRGRSSNVQVMGERTSCGATSFPQQVACTRHLRQVVSNQAEGLT